MSHAEAVAADAADPLRPLRERFDLPEGLIYLDGNSLGPLPRAAPERLRAVTQSEWGEDLIRSWNENDWIGAPQRLGAKIAPLIGAKPNEVIVADSTSVNLFKLLVAASRLSEPQGAADRVGQFPDRRLYRRRRGRARRPHPRRRAARTRWRAGSAPTPTCCC